MVNSLEMTTPNKTSNQAFSQAQPNTSQQTQSPQPTNLIPVLNPQYRTLFFNPSTQLLMTRLTDTNFLVWRQQVYASVRGYGLEGFLNGYIHGPPTHSPNLDGLPPLVNHGFTFNNDKTSFLLPGY